MTNSITGTETLGGTQHVNVGWSMIGNDPVAGITNAMSMVHTNDAVLTWLWTTNYMLKASALGNGSVTGDTNGFYASGATVTVTAVPTLGSLFAGWSGNVSGPTNNAAQTMTMDQARTVVAHFSSDQVSLEIISEHGIGVPPVGIYLNDYGTPLTNSITGIETIGGTQHVNVGWSMIGNDPVAGITNSMSMVHTNDAVLTWLWTTNYMLNAAADLNGTITGDTNGFYAGGATVTVTAIPDAGFHFTGWTGNVSGPTNTAAKSMTMDQARTVVAHFAIDAVAQLTLEIISKHGTGTPPVGIYTHNYGSLLTNSITGIETIGGTQHVNVGWSMIGNAPAAGITNGMSMVLTDNAVLTWLWTTNYYLTLSAVHGSIINATTGWKPRGWSYSPMPVPDFGYVFDHWEVNGVNQGSAAPLPVTMNAAKTVKAVFTPAFIDVTGQIGMTVTWVFDPRKGYFLGTLTIKNINSRKVMMAPFWFEVKSTPWHWLRHPTGHDNNTGNDYIDISADVISQLSSTGNRNQILEPGESVTITGIELMGRRTPTGLVMAVWADPPGTSSLEPDIGIDTDHDGIPDVWENLYPDVLNANNPLDATLDSDSDGMTNLEEYVAGTDPSDAESRFTIIPAPGAGIGVTWEGRPDRVYTVLASRDLRKEFTVVNSNIVGIGATITHLEMDAQALGSESGGAIFYRVEVRIK